METATLEARIGNPAFVVPGAMEALQSLPSQLRGPGSTRSSSS